MYAHTSPKSIYPPKAHVKNKSGGLFLCPWGATNLMQTQCAPTLHTIEQTACSVHSIFQDVTYLHHLNDVFESSASLHNSSLSAIPLDPQSLIEVHTNFKTAHQVPLYKPHSNLQTQSPLSISTEPSKQVNRPTRNLPQNALAEMVVSRLYV